MGLFRRERRLRALQVEVTTRCTRGCALCPRTALAGRWRERDLSAAAWAAIVPALGQVEHLHLQGWGEPLLHPDLREMAAAGKRAGCAVGITTNGELLGEAIDWLVATCVDLVTVSVGGTAHHATLRGGLDLERALEPARELAHRSGRPRVQLSFLLTSDNAAELEEVVAAAARGGVREVYAVHVDCTPTGEVLERAAFGASGLARGVAEAIRAAGDAAARLGVTFRPPARGPEKMITCALEPVRFACVAADGRVGPCVYQLLPIDGPIPRQTEEGAAAVEPCCYGRVPDEDLSTILGSAARSAFAAPFAARLAAEQAFRGSLLNDDYRGVAAEYLRQADERRAAALAANPFPPACCGCHKRQGW